MEVALFVSEFGYDQDAIGGDRFGVGFQSNRRFFCSNFTQKMFLHQHGFVKKFARKNHNTFFVAKHIFLKIDLNKKGFDPNHSRQESPIKIVTEF
jgi:hypothetical protein